MKQAIAFGISITIAMIVIFSQLNEIERLEQKTIKQTEIITKLKKENALLYQTQDLEHFLMMLLNPKQKKDFLTVEDYCKQFFMEHRK